MNFVSKKLSLIYAYFLVIGICLAQDNRILEQLGFDVICPTIDFDPTKPALELEDNSLPDCHHLEPFSMHLIDKYLHGSSVQAVSWCINNATHTYLAAIGGYKSYVSAGFEGTSVRILQLLTSPDRLIEIDSFLPSDCIYSLDWCSIQDTPYLAIGGIANKKTNYDTFICKYVHGAIIPVAWFSHNNTVYSVAWLPTTDNQVSTRYLAIGGDPYQEIATRILKFDPLQTTEKRLTVHANAHHANTVYSVSWYMQQGQKPILAAGGATTAMASSEKSNIILYSFDAETGNLNVLSKSLYEGPIVRCLCWYNEPDAHDDQAYLLVGGDATSNYTKDKKHTRIFKLDLKKSPQLTPFIQEYQTGKIFAVSWIAACEGKYFSQAELIKNYGGHAFKVQTYEFSKDQNPLISSKTSFNFENLVNCLSWTCIGSCTYLLVGIDSENWLSELTNSNSLSQEIYLFKGRFTETCLLRKNKCHF